MTTDLKTVIGQLKIAGGSWQNDTPNQIAVREPQPKAASEQNGVPGAGKGDLFVLVEVRGPVSNPDYVEQQLAESIRDCYYLARGSITASLRRALQEAGSQLYEHNQQAEERVTAGVAAIVVNHNDIFVAQTGPSAVYALLSNYLRRYPTQSPWLDEALTPEREAQLPALGTHRITEPNLHHVRVSPDDVLILADSGLAAQMPLSDVIKSVTPRNTKTTIKRLGKAARSGNCSALVVSVEEAGSALESLKRNTSNVKKMSEAAVSPLNRLFNRGRRQETGEDTPRSAPQPATEAIAAEAVVASVPEVMDSSTAAAGGEQPMSRFFNRSVHSEPAATPASRRPQPQSVDDYLNPNEPEIPVEQEARVMASMAQDTGFTPGWRESSSSSSISINRIGRSIGLGLLMVIALLGKGLKNLFALVLPQSGEQPPTRQAGAHVYRNQSSFISWTMLRNIAIAIPILVAIVVGVIYLQKGRMVEAEYTKFYTSAQNKFQQAQAIALTDPATAIGLMEEAEVSLAQAEEIKAGQPEIIEMRQQMAAIADEIGNVQRLYYLPQLRQYTDPGTRLKRLVVQGVELYVLDSGTDRIFHHRLDDLGETLLPDDEASLVLAARGEQVEGITMEDILDMVWMPAGGNRQTSDLVALNTTGLLEFNPNWGITTAALAGGELMSLPVAVSSYFGNFYILDPQANRLLRYLPTADGYSAQPDSYFSDEQPVDLSNAVDFAIDGAVYILFRDGQLEKYQSGQPVEFTLTGLDKPFKNPASVFTAPDEQVQYVYVADAGNQRIVQLEKDGRFVRQFKPREGEEVAFANLQDIYVDEIGSRLYILDSNNLYVGNIPTETVQ